MARNLLRLGTCDRFAENGGTENGQNGKEEFEIRTRGRGILVGNTAVYRGDLVLYVKHKRAEDFITLPEILEQMMGSKELARVIDGAYRIATEGDWRVLKAIQQRIREVRAYNELVTKIRAGNR